MIVYLAGHQRIGLLYGRHVVHKEVPLGIRAEVAAIYEPPQEATADIIKLLPNPNKELVDQVHVVQFCPTLG